MPRSDYPDHSYLPTLLTKEEIQDPYTVLDNIFINYHLPELRKDLQELFDCLVTGNYPKNTNRIERSDMVFMFRKIERLIEAAHLIYKNGK